MKVIEFNNVWKKFRRGERLASLRDAIPHFFRSALSKNGLDKKEFWAVRDVNFKVNKGEVVGIIGPNGSGKSTILKLLSRIFVPNKGSIAIKGRLSALIEVTAGFHPDFTGRENVYFNGAILGMTKREIDRKFDKIVEFSEIEEFIDTPVKRYSSGMSARLGFSIAAHVDPDVLLVDEVLAVGDMSFQVKCAKMMRELLNSGVTIVLVAHNLPLIQSLCKRVLLLNKGQIQKEGRPEEVIPYYENLVYTKSEEALRKELDSRRNRVTIDREATVKISDALLYNGEYKAKEEFKISEPISIRINYEAKEKIDNPLFCLDIIRADGVICCSSNTKNNGIKKNFIQGKGYITIDLGNINLGPGIYVTKISILDKEMMHPYAIRKEDIFRIEKEGFVSSSSAVFLPKIEWKIE